MKKEEFVKAIQQDLQVVRIKTGADMGSALINKQDVLDMAYKLDESEITVDKEQLYTVIIPSIDTLWRYHYLSVKGGIGVTDSYKEIDRVTERLIRSIDDRLMAFAEKVEDE